jgi:hypothetical protein
MYYLAGRGAGLVAYWCAAGEPAACLERRGSGRSPGRPRRLGGSVSTCGPAMGAVPGAGPRAGVAREGVFRTRRALAWRVRETPAARLATAFVARTADGTAAQRGAKRPRA